MHAQLTNTKPLHTNSFHLRRHASWHTHLSWSVCCFASPQFEQFSHDAILSTQDHYIARVASHHLKSIKWALLAILLTITC